MPDKEIAWTRKSIRMHADDAVDAEMWVSGIGNRQVRTKSRKVLLLELAPDWLRFRTTLWMPPDGEWSVTLKFMLEGVPIEASGRIAQASGERHWWTYAVDLDPDPVKRAVLTKVLNQRLKAKAPLLYRIHEAYRKQSWG
ncbi:hypothetical protein GE107_20335 [Cohnella sp. CFH 77786]|uniref:hypothetical protein n=1 Tax=Cohnella sp. CFH 77786 TaxID=2662265 RepID=UPI001C60ABA2|nr:hypothetical protein [Cohnella sp. CFH 77786]MBW5448396.1 hypothetical protein [Cohnella sp. CFH 77786]